jgi:hypothetical protein
VRPVADNSLNLVSFDHRHPARQVVSRQLVRRPHLPGRLLSFAELTGNQIGERRAINRLRDILIN